MVQFCLEFKYNIQGNEIRSQNISRKLQPKLAKTEFERIIAIENFCSVQNHRFDSINAISENSTK